MLHVDSKGQFRQVRPSEEQGLLTLNGIDFVPSQSACGAGPVPLQEVCVFYVVKTKLCDGHEALCLKHTLPLSIENVYTLDASVSGSSMISLFQNLLPLLGMKTALCSKKSSLNVLMISGSSALLAGQIRIWQDSHSLLNCSTFKSSSIGESRSPTNSAEMQMSS